MNVFFPRRKTPRLLLWLGVPTALFLAALLVFLYVGRWLVLEDPLQKAHAIVVLSGRVPSRALEAARVYKQGYADRVWLTHAAEPGAALAELSIQYPGDDFYNKLVLLHEGVPESAIQVLDPPIENTADEMQTIGAALRRQNQHSVILVTSKVHTRRVATLWKHLAGRDGMAIVRGVSDDPFDPAHWWRDTRDALDVVREVLGLANAYAGLPLQPAAQ
jgi:uncharacterized SAM-binding protein YcdF (DUF218 family)